MSTQTNFGWIEEELESSLNPVVPRQEFIMMLRQRLVTPANVQLEAPSRTRQYLPVAAGLMGGIILIWLVKRILTYFTKKT